MRNAMLLMVGLALAGCDVDFAGSFDDSLLLLDAEGRDGRVLFASPATDSVIEVNRADRSVRTLAVGENPVGLERPPGSDLLYTLHPQTRTLSRIDTEGNVTETDLGGPFNRLFWAPDGQQAIAVFDGDLGTVDLTELGSLNPNAIALLTDIDGEVTVRQYTLTYPPQGVVFDPGSTRALISTQARLHVLDLETLEEQAIPFSQQAGVQRRPDQVVPNSDGTRALVSVIGLSEVFVISLDPVLIENVIGLPRRPTELAFAPGDGSAIILDGSLSASFLDLASFETDTLPLASTASSLTVGTGPDGPFALLYAPGLSGLARVMLPLDGSAPEEADEYVLDAGVGRLEVEPGGTAAVILHQASGGSAISSESVSLFDFNERAPSRIFLDTPAVDLLFVEAGVVDGSDAPYVMVALEQSARLVRYNLRTYEQVVFDTYPRPMQLGVLPAGPDSAQQIFVVHGLDTGLVSFVPPGASEEPPAGWPAVSGLVTLNLLERE